MNFFLADVDLQEAPFDVDRDDISFLQVDVSEEEKSIIEGIDTQSLHQIARKTFVRDTLNLIVVGPFTPELKKKLEGLVAEF